MPKNPAEMQSGQFEKGARIRFEDVKVGMIVKIKIINSENKLETFEGIVDSIQEAGDQTKLPRGPHLLALAETGFYVSLKDKTTRIAWKNEIKDIEFQGYDPEKTSKDVQRKARGVDIAPGPGRDKLASQLREIFKNKHGRYPTDAELEALIRGVAQVSQDASKGN